MRANRYFGLEARLVSSCPTTLQVSIGHSELIVFESDRAVHSFPCRLRSYHPRALPLRVLLFMLFIIHCSQDSASSRCGRTRRRASGPRRRDPLLSSQSRRRRAGGDRLADGHHHRWPALHCGQSGWQHAVKVIVEGLRPHTFKRWRCEYNKNAQMQIRVQKAVDELKVGCN